MSGGITLESSGQSMRSEYLPSSPSKFCIAYITFGNLLNGPLMITTKNCKEINEPMLKFCVKNIKNPPIEYIDAVKMKLVAFEATADFVTSRRSLCD